MSISSIDDNLLHLLAARAKKTAAATADFDTALNAATTPDKAQTTAQSAMALAAALRMELLRSVATFGDDNDSEGPDLGALEQALSSQANIAASRPAAVAATAVPVAPAAYRQDNSLPALIAKASQRYQVAPELIRAVIHAESGFNPQAVSPAGAQGLMQLMPATAADLGVHDPFDAEQNIMGGTRYLRQLLDKYHGHLDSALAAYNWGPGHVDQQSDPLPQETRNYIKRIRGYLTDTVG